MFDQTTVGSDLTDSFCIDDDEAISNNNSYEEQLSGYHDDQESDLFGVVSTLPNTPSFSPPSRNIYMNEPQKQQMPQESSNVVLQYGAYDKNGVHGKESNITVIDAQQHVSFPQNDSQQSHLQETWGTTQTQSPLPVTTPFHQQNNPYPHNILHQQPALPSYVINSNNPSSHNHQQQTQRQLFSSISISNIVKIVPPVLSDYTFGKLFQSSSDAASNFWIYEITTNRSDAGQETSAVVVKRRYNHFMEFHSNLRKAHPCCVIPILPPKDSILEQSNNFVKRRAIGLVRYLTELIRHDIVGNSNELREFLTLVGTDISVNYELQKRQKENEKQLNKHQQRKEKGSFLRKYQNYAMEHVSTALDYVVPENTEEVDPNDVPHPILSALIDMELDRIDILHQALPKLAGLSQFHKEMNKARLILGVELSKKQKGLKHSTGGNDKCVNCDEALKMLSKPMILAGRIEKKSSGMIHTDAEQSFWEKDSFVVTRTTTSITAAISDYHKYLKRVNTHRKNSVDAEAKALKSCNTLRILNRHAEANVLEKDFRSARETYEKSQEELDKLAKILQNELEQCRMEWRRVLCKEITNMVHRSRIGYAEQLALWQTTRIQFETKFK